MCCVPRAGLLLTFGSGARVYVVGWNPLLAVLSLFCALMFPLLLWPRSSPCHLMALALFQGRTLVPFLPIHWGYPVLPISLSGFSPTLFLKGGWF